MSDVIAYVRSSAQLLDLTLDDAQVERVALHLARTRGIAAVLANTPLAPADELAEIFRPAPFPAEDAAWS
ncbi:MAG TPA: DUF4089 domain-containing protein [Albitalea sp.]|nr:DUF4089 domain-containing protein [Albitalea sp.]